MRWVGCIATQPKQSDATLPMQCLGVALQGNARLRGASAPLLHCLLHRFAMHGRSPPCNALGQGPFSETPNPSDGTSNPCEACEACPCEAWAKGENVVVAVKEVRALADFHLSTRLFQLLFCLLSFVLRDRLLYCFWKRGSKFLRFF